MVSKHEQLIYIGPCTAKTLHNCTQPQSDESYEDSTRRPTRPHRSRSTGRRGERARANQA